MKQFIREAQRLQKLAGIAEAKVIPVSLMQKSPYLFIDADGFLEIDIDNFKKYILSNLEIIKNLWNNDGGDWDLDNITQEELNKAIKTFQLDFPDNIQDRIDLTTNNPAQDYLSSWDKKEEIEILKIFLNTLNDVINQLDEAKVVPSSYNYSKLFADFLADDPKTDIINRFARTIAELLRITSEYMAPNENNEFTDLHIDEVFSFGGMNDIEDGDEFYAGPNESLKTFRSLPKTFTVNSNMDYDMESWQITKTGPNSFNAKIIANTNEAKVVPQRMPRRLKGQISEEEWKAIGPNFTTDEIVINYDTDASDTIFETPQGFRFNMAPYHMRNGEVLVYELQYNDYDPDPGIEEWIDDQVNELKQQLSNAGYKLEVDPFDGGMMLYIPV